MNLEKLKNADVKFAGKTNEVCSPATDIELTGEPSWPSCYIQTEESHRDAISTTRRRFQRAAHAAAPHGACLIECCVRCLREILIFSDSWRNSGPSARSGSVS